MAAGLLFFSQPAAAQPVLVGPPPTIDGQEVKLPIVRKHGRLWYPASVVGHHRNIDFAYDHSTGKIYAHGAETAIETLVVDGIVYVPIAPQVTEQNRLPGKEILRSMRPQFEQYEDEYPIKKGNADALYQHMDVATPAHPWSAPQVTYDAPVLDLDPTGNTQVPAHLRPGAAPPHRPAEPLPNRLTRPGSIPPAEVSATVQPVSPTAEQRVGIGGPPKGLVDNSSQALQPLPYAQPSQVEPANQRVAAAAPTQLKPSSGKNNVFEVAVQSARLAESAGETLLSVKLEQVNLSVVPQSNLGSFALRCQDGSRIEPVRTRSFLPEGTLAPGQQREGELLFRMPGSAVPRSLELEGTIPLSVPLQQ